MSDLVPGMHDHPGIFPTLPPREPDALEGMDVFGSERGVWKTCWEYVLTHQMTDTERAAFWTAANLMYHARGG